MIRLFGLRDILLIKRLEDKGAHLDLESAVLESHSPLARALFDYFSLHRRGSTLVLDTRLSEGRAQGFVQARDRGGVPLCDLLYISPSLAHSPLAPKVWPPLLEGVCAKGGERGVQRFLAKVEGRSEAVDLFKGIGFRPYARRWIFRLERLPREGEGPLLRPRRVEDGWRLQRLYESVTPRPVQQVEGWESRGVSRYWQRGAKEYVAQRGEEIVAYFCLLSGRRGCWLKALIHPEAGGEVDLLRCALGWMGSDGTFPLFSGARGYEASLKSSLLELGFEPMREELLMVKHTTVRVEASPAKPVRALEREMGGVTTLQRF